MWKDGVIESISYEDPKGRNQVRFLFLYCSLCFMFWFCFSPPLGLCLTIFSNTPQDLSMDYVLGNCPDFKNEKGALQALVEARGHILVMSPKGHCELAGNGIEYDWGKMKQNFRRKNRYRGFHELILDSMSREVLPLSTSRKFARKARAYRRAYREGVDNQHACIEAMIKEFRSHRNAADFAGSFIRQA